MTATADLLKRHRPFLKYDSQESYFSDSAALDGQPGQPPAQQER